MPQLELVSGLNSKLGEKMTLVDALEAMESSSEKIKLEAMKLCEEELKLYLQLAEEAAAHPAPFINDPYFHVERVQQRIFSDEEWALRLFGLMMGWRSIRSGKGVCSIGDFNSSLKAFIGFCQPLQKKWTERLLLGKPGFVVTRKLKDKANW